MLYNDKVEKVLFLQAFFVFLYIIFYSFLYIFTLTYSYFFPILFLKVRRKIRLPTNPRILYNNTSTDLFGHTRKQRHGWYICIYFLLNIYSSICIPIPCPNFGRSGYYLSLSVRMYKVHFVRYFKEAFYGHTYRCHRNYCGKSFIG